MSIAIMFFLNRPQLVKTFCFVTNKMSDSVKFLSGLQHSIENDVISLTLVHDYSINTITGF